MKVSPEEGHDRGQVAFVSDAYPDSRLAIPALVIGILAVVLLVNFGFAWYWIAAVIVAAIAVVATVSWKAFVEADSKLVREEGRLFGLKLLAHRLIPLSEFEAVVVQHIKTTDDDDWRVGLLHRSGRKIWMQYFVKNDPKHSNSEFAASGLAMALSERTKLPVQDVEPPDPGHWLRRVKLRKSRRGSA